MGSVTLILALAGCGWEEAPEPEAPVQELTAVGPDGTDPRARIAAAEDAARARATAPPRVRPAPSPRPAPVSPAPAEPRPLAPDSPAPKRVAVPVTPAPPAQPEPRPLAPEPRPLAPEPEPLAPQPKPLAPEPLAPQPRPLAPSARSFSLTPEPLPTVTTPQPEPVAEPEPEPEPPPPVEPEAEAEPASTWASSFNTLVQAARSLLPGSSEPVEPVEPVQDVRDAWIDPVPDNDGVASLPIGPEPPLAIGPGLADNALAIAEPPQPLPPKGITEEYTEPVPLAEGVEEVAMPAPDFRLQGGFDPSATTYDDAPRSRAVGTVASGGSRTSSLDGPTAEMFHRIEDDCSPAEVEPLADIGALTAVHRGCMEVKIGSASSMALRNRLSLALIANATAQQDASWVGLVQRHLDEVDEGNATLALRLGVHQLGQGRAVTAYRLAQSALDHRAAWTPEAYEDRTWAAYQLRAAAAQAWWQRMFEEGVDFDGIELARIRTVDAATEWADYARHVERKGIIATKLCREAGAEC